MKFRTFGGPALLLAGAFVLLAGCSSGRSSPQESGVEVSLAPTLTGYLVQTGLNAGSGGAAARTALDNALVGDTTLHGTMAITDVNNVPVEGSPFSWSISLDPNHPLGAVASNRTVALFPGTYNFSLLITDNSQEYVGSATAAIAEGENSVQMRISPVIGDTATDVDMVWELPEIRFNYPEMGAISNPTLGVFIDEASNNQSQFYLVDIDPATGNFFPLQTNFQQPGTVHTLRLELYSNSLLRGRSVAVQENFVAGVDVVMDLVSIHGDTVIVLNEITGDATFTFAFPYVVAHEAGGVNDLLALYAISGEGNPFQEGALQLVDNGVGNPVTASLTFPGFQFGQVHISVAFSDATDGDLLGTCHLGPVTLVARPGASTLCDLTLRRRQVVGGNLLAVLGVNVVDPGYVPVPGATVSLNGNPVGITGSGFGTPGYLKILTPAGPYTVGAEKGLVTGEALVSAVPLGIHNLEVQLGGSVVFDDSDGDGVLDPFDQCPNTPAGTPVESDGCPPPKPEKNPNAIVDYGMVFTEVGDPGRAGGMTWAITGIDPVAAGKSLLLSILMDDPDPSMAPYGISLDGPDRTGAEIVVYDTAQSDPANGLAIFTGQTRILNVITGVTSVVATRIVVRLLDGSGGALGMGEVPPGFLDVDLGKVGFQVPFDGDPTDSSKGAYSLHFSGEVLSGANWVPYLNFFDSFPTNPAVSTGFSFGATYYDM